MNLQPRVVLFEDDLMNAQMIKERLKESNLDVEHVKSLRGFKKKVEENHLDAAIIDIMVKQPKKRRPRPIGLTAIEHLRQVRPDIYIEVQTGYPEHIEEAKRRGADHIIKKDKGYGLDVSNRIYKGVMKKKIELLERELNIRISPLPEEIFLEPYKAALAIVNASALIRYMPDVQNLIHSRVQRSSTNNDFASELSNDVLELITRRAMGIAKERITVRRSENRVNSDAFRENIQQLREHHLGEYVAFVGGKLVFNNKDINKVLEFIENKHPDDVAFVKKVDKSERRYHLGGAKIKI